MIVAIPYVWALAGQRPFADAVAAGFVAGTLLTIAFASLGIIVSIFSNSNRLSLAASFFVFVVLRTHSATLSGWFEIS
jgi:ABC-2 type transport system permease protein